MSYTDRVKVYKEMDKEFGRDARMFKIIEELSELIKELSKVGQGSANIQKLCDEIADAKVGIEQLEMFFTPNGSIVEEIMDFKTVRTRAFHLDTEDDFVGAPV